MLRLKELRKKKRFTQQEVADKLNIARASYTNIENGRRDPDTKTLVKLANYFGVTVDYLLGLTDTPLSPLQPSVSDEERKILEVIKSLSPDRQKALEVALRILKSEQEEAASIKQGVL